MSDTPLTDRCAEGVDQSNFEDSWKDDFEEFAWVPADFARDLERQLAAARADFATIARNPGDCCTETGFTSGHIARAAIARIDAFQEPPSGGPVGGTP